MTDLIIYRNGTLPELLAALFRWFLYGMKIDIIFFVLEFTKNAVKAV